MPPQFVDLTHSLPSLRVVAKGGEVNLTCTVIASPRAKVRRSQSIYDSADL